VKTAHVQRGEEATMSEHAEEMKRRLREMLASLEQSTVKAMADQYREALEFAIAEIDKEGK
jgi:hypothetical protein